MSAALALRLVTAAGALVAGALVGLCAVVLHDRWWGLLLGLAATAALLAAVPGGWWRRSPVALGWAVCVVLLTRTRPEGDYLIAGDVSGYALLTAAIAVLITGVVSLRPPRRGGADDSGVAE